LINTIVLKLINNHQSLQEQNTNHNLSNDHNMIDHDIIMINLDNYKLLQNLTSYTCVYLFSNGIITTGIVYLTFNNTSYSYCS